MLWIYCSKQRLEIHKYIKKSWQNGFFLNQIRIKQKNQISCLKCCIVPSYKKYRFLGRCVVFKMRMSFDRQRDNYKNQFNSKKKHTICWKKRGEKNCTGNFDSIIILIPSVTESSFWCFVSSSTFSSLSTWKMCMHLYTKVSNQEYKKIQ